MGTSHSSEEGPRAPTSRETTGAKDRPLPAPDYSCELLSDLNLFFPQNSKSVTRATQAVAVSLHTRARLCLQTKDLDTFLFHLCLQKFRRMVVAQEYEQSGLRPGQPNASKGSRGEVLLFSPRVTAMPHISRKWLHKSNLLPSVPLK